MTCSNNVCGTGLGTVTLPSDPDNVVVINASSAFGGVDITWSYPTVNPHAVAYVVLYRSTTMSFNSAVEIARIGGNHYYDKVEPEVDTMYYYWIIIVSVNGTEGSVIGPASAVARPYIEQVISNLANRINEGTLATSLRSEIDRIELIYTDLLAEQQDRIDGLLLLSTALQAVQGSADYAVSAINDEIQARIEANSAIVTEVNAIAAGNEDVAALVQTESEARVSADEAFAEQITLLASKTDLENYVTSATIAADYYTKTDTESAITTALEDYVSTTDLSDALGDYSTSAAISTTYSTKTETASAISTAVTGLVSTSALTTTLGSYVTSSFLTTNYKTKADTESAISTAVTGLVSTTAMNTALGDYVKTATLTSNYQTATDTASAIATAIETAQSSIDENIASVQTTLQTSIDDVNDVLEAIYTVKVDVNGVVGGFGIYGTETEVEAGFNVDTFWVGRYDPETETNKSSYPFMINEDGEVLIKNALIQGLSADHIDTRGLSIKDAEGNVIFSAGNALDWSRVSGTNKPADGATVGAEFGVNISGKITPSNVSTFIANAAIGGAHIADAAIDSAKIANAAIKEASIDSLSVSTIKIKNNAVTTLVSGTVSGFFHQNAAVNTWYEQDIGLPYTPTSAANGGSGKLALWLGMDSLSGNSSSITGIVYLLSSTGTQYLELVRIQNGASTVIRTFSTTNSIQWSPVIIVDNVSTEYPVTYRLRLKTTGTPNYVVLSNFNYGILEAKK